MSNYFSKCKTPQEVKDTFKKLAFQHHPDITGRDTNAEMAAIIEEYHRALAALDGFQSMGSDDKVHTYHYRENVEQDIAEVIDKLVAAKLHGVTIEIIGTWVWVYGDTKPHRQTLKEFGLRWHSRRQMWYKAPRGARATYNARATIKDLRHYYGSSKVVTESQKLLEE